MLACTHADLPAAAQVHLGKKLPNGESRSYDISEEEFHELSFQFQRFSGAMLANIVNTAVILAGREGRTVIKYHDLTRVRLLQGPATPTELLKPCPAPLHHDHQCTPCWPTL